MLVNKRDEIYFVDRNNSIFQVENLSFVKYNNLHEHLEDTLLDGVSFNGQKCIKEIIEYYFYYSPQGNGFGQISRPKYTKIPHI